MFELFPHRGDHVQILSAEPELVRRGGNPDTVRDSKAGLESYTLLSNVAFLGIGDRLGTSGDVADCFNILFGEANLIAADPNPAVFAEDESESWLNTLRVFSIVRVLYQLQQKMRELGIQLR